MVKIRGMGNAEMMNGKIGLQSVTICILVVRDHLGNEG